MLHKQCVANELGTSTRDSDRGGVVPASSRNRLELRTYILLFTSVVLACCCCCCGGCARYVVVYRSTGTAAGVYYTWYKLGGCVPVGRGSKAPAACKMLMFLPCVGDTVDPFKGHVHRVHSAESTTRRESVLVVSISQSRAPVR